jgi:hypothetical protein
MVQKLVTSLFAGWTKKVFSMRREFKQALAPYSSAANSLDWTSRAKQHGRLTIERRFIKHCRSKWLHGDTTHLLSRQQRIGEIGEIGKQTTGGILEAQLAAACAYIDFFEKFAERMTLIRMKEFAAPEAIRAGLLKKEDL